MSKIQNAIEKLTRRENLDEALVRDAFEEIMTGKTTPAQTAGFLVALSMKGETPEEIAACADVMRSVATPLDVEEETLEIVGTGGDRLGTFNISTACAILCAAAGVPTTKHGNRSVSSKSGAADCLEALGVNIELGAREGRALLDRTNFCFMFAPVYHSAMRFAGPVRKELAVPTVFNILGPLTNPAKASLQLLGVYDATLLEPMAKVLMALGVKRGLVVHGRAGEDEISISGPTDAILIMNEEMERIVIRPEDFSFKAAPIEEVQGENAQENARMIEDIFKGEKSARRDIVAMNAGAALFLAGKADSIEEGVRLAESILDSGKALEKLGEIREISSRDLEGMSA